MQIGNKYAKTQKVNVNQNNEEVTVLILDKVERKA